ncbi:hypothetical protein GCM10022419_016210 [Nonomuraea rosea]|uniref:Uncharacterized protein n=1 Tax=Nonomuraea rosea TaxID=638574 RepID=A0ABP6VQB5_9ACTN
MTFSNVALNASKFCLVYTSSGVAMPLANGVHKVDFKANVKHTAELYLDGVRFTPSPALVVAAGATGQIRLPVPNDGRHHFVKVVDTKTSSASSAEIEVWSGCVGVVYFVVSTVTQNPATNEQLVDVRMTNSGQVSQAYTTRLLLDGKTVGTQITLNPGQQETRRITIPADSANHVISGEVRIGSAFADDVCLWYVIKGNAAPPVPPDPSDNASQFVPGETVIIQSAVTSTPLATDGSEWVLVEISPRDANTWTPAGTEGGFITPQEDGTWSASIPTNATAFPVGSEWDVRARRFRDYQQSDEVIHYFDMVTGTVTQPPVDGGGTPQPTLNAPVITGPTNRDQWGGTWLTIYGTGTPGARVEFKTERVTAWGQTNYVPKATTVGSNGKWSTQVFAKKQAQPNSYKVLGYRGRIHKNALFSPWSNRLDVTWHHPRR